MRQILAWRFDGAQGQSVLEAICLGVKWIIETESSELNAENIKDVTLETKAGQKA